MGHPPYRDVTVGDLLTRLSTDLPDADALVCVDGPRYTFRTLEREARTIARGLLAIGVEPGERVVMWATNVPEWVVLQFALAKIGAIVVAAHTASRARDIDYLLTRSGAGTLITMSGFRGHDYLATLRDLGADAGHIPTLKRLILLGPGAPAGFFPYTRLRDVADRVDESMLEHRAAMTALDDPVNIQFTSVRPVGRKAWCYRAAASSTMRPPSATCLDSRQPIGCACACRCFTRLDTRWACSAATPTAPPCVR